MNKAKNIATGQKQYEIAKLKTFLGWVWTRTNGNMTVVREV